MLALCKHSSAELIQAVFLVQLLFRDRTLVALSCPNQGNKLPNKEFSTRNIKNNIQVALTMN